MKISVTMRHMSQYGVGQQEKLFDRFTLETAVGCKHSRAGAEREKRSTQCHYESKLRY